MKTGITLRAIAEGATEATIEIMGVIGWDVAYETLRSAIAQIPDTVERVVFDIYSPGGDVWAGNGIIHEIGKMKQTTVARVQVAASMATLIAVACDERSIASNGRFLIHNAWTITTGDADSHEKRAKELRACEDEAVAFYAARSNGKKTTDEIRALMGEERWITPAEAQEFGFIDEIEDPFAPADFADLRAEIIAAGKWPAGLAEIPGEEDQDDDATTNGTEGTGVPAGPSPADDDSGENVPADTAAEIDARITAAKSEGIAEGKASSVKELTDAADAVARWVEKHNAVAAELKLSITEARKLQGERDQARAALAKRTAEVADMTAKLTRLLAGGLTFTPAVDTWEQALKACGNSYEEARKKFPEVYRAQREHDKASRK